MFWITFKTMHPWWYHYIMFWLSFLQGLIGIISFGIIYSEFTLSFSRWYARYTIKKLKEKRNETANL